MEYLESAKSTGAYWIISHNESWSLIVHLSICIDLLLPCMQKHPNLLISLPSMSHVSDVILGYHEITREGARCKTKPHFIVLMGAASSHPPRGAVLKCRPAERMLARSSVREVAVALQQQLCMLRLQSQTPTLTSMTSDFFCWWQDNEITTPGPRGARCFLSITETSMKIAPFASQYSRCRTLMTIWKSPI